MESPVNRRCSAPNREFLRRSGNLSRKSEDCGPDRGSAAAASPLRQILLCLPQSLYRPVDPLADCSPVEILLPAKPLKRHALDQVVFEQLLLVWGKHLESLHCPVLHPLDVRIQVRLA